MILSGYTIGIIDTIWPIVLVFTVSYLFYYFREEIRNSHWRKTIPIILLLIMLTTDGGYIQEIAKLPFGPIKDSFSGLPLHLCGSSAALVMLYLGFKKEIFLDILLIQGFVGALVTFIFPSISSSPADFGYWTFFIAHAVLFITPAFFMIIEGKRIEKKHLIIGLVFIHILAYTNVIINESLGLDYMYLNSDNAHNLFSFVPINTMIPALDSLIGVLIFGEILVWIVYPLTYFVLKFLQGDYKKKEDRV